jgi:hypothetical protein
MMNPILLVNDLVLALDQSLLWLEAYHPSLPKDFHFVAAILVPNLHELLLADFFWGSKNTIFCVF